MSESAVLVLPEVAGRAIEAGDEHDVPLNSLEGFVRQVIGWREFMRGVYLAEGSVLREANELGHSRPLPAAFHEATTGLTPLDETIERVRARGWCHHIERLMVLGNAMRLSEIEPAAGYEWFMEHFVDAFEWVMVPNVFPMSQYADGGTLTTKPYVSSSDYLRKTSDYPKGPWCDVWDGLFWRFVKKRRDLFAGNPRTAVLARQLDRMGRTKLRAKLRAAEGFLEELWRPEAGRQRRSAPVPAPRYGVWQSVQ